MARIPEQEIERLKNEVSVERLVEASGIELKRGGKDLLGRCPFHEDDTASLVVTPAKNLWHCFGCGIGGGPIDWVIKRRGVSFRHAVELLREGFTSLAAEGGSIKRSTVRALAAPVAFDADDQALLNQTIDYYHERLRGRAEAWPTCVARAGPSRAGRALQARHRRPHARAALAREEPQGRRRHPRALAENRPHARQRSRALQRQPGRAGVRRGGQRC